MFLGGDRVDKIKVTFTLERETRIRLKVYAAKTNNSVSETIERAIKEYLDRNPVK